MLVSLGGGAGTGVRRDRMDDWEDINAKDALVTLTNLQDGKIPIFGFTYDRSLRRPKHSATNGQT